MDDHLTRVHSAKNLATHRYLHTCQPTVPTPTRAIMAIVAEVKTNKKKKLLIIIYTRVLLISIKKLWILCKNHNIFIVYSIFY